MKQTQDQDIVGGWLKPVQLGDMLACLREAGFSGDVYRGCFADLEASLEDDEAGALHFLRHGFSEGRVFRVALDVAGLERLRRLPLRNRFYLQNLLIALVAAWAASEIRSLAGLARHPAAFDRLRRMGGRPLVILGDASAELYRRGAARGEHWILPLAMAPIESIEVLRRTPLPDLSALRQGELEQPTIPILWKFGQSDIQGGYLLHRLRHRLGADDRGAFAAFAGSVIDGFASYLRDNVAPEARARHWIASLFPPVWRLEPQTPASAPAMALVEEFGASLPQRLRQAGADTLGERTAMHHAFNQMLEESVTALGFNIIHDFESFLTADGLIDEHYLVPTRASDHLDYRASAGILSTSLWSIIDASGVPAAAPASIGETFGHLLEEIRLVQLGEPRA